MNKLILMTLIIMTSLVHGFSQSLSNVSLEHMHKPSVRKEIKIPNIMGYQTLKCDFHIHTIFSDGIVWPSFRVDEAWEEGLDAIAITDHIEDNPSKPHVGGDHNSSYEVALPRAQKKGIILVRGGEITRSMPPGHLNAIFLNDVNLLDTPDPIDAIQAAADQGAFIMWNHPGWKAQQPDTCEWMPMHQEIFEKGLIHGIEVFNEKEWYPLVLDWCLEKELAVLGNSDIHDVNAHYYDVENGHRPMNLVFAKEKSADAIKEAIFARRTITFFDGKLAGSEVYLKAIFEASISVVPTGETDKKNRTLCQIQNNSDIPFLLENEKGNKLNIPADASVIVALSRDDFKQAWVRNLFVGSQTNLQVSFDF